MILIALMYVSFFLAQRASNVCACKHPFKKCRLPIDHLPCVLSLHRPLALLGCFSSLQHDFSLARPFLADPFLEWIFVAAWRRIVAAFVSFVCWRLLLYVWCKECFPRVYVRDDLLALCDFRSSSRTFAIAYYSIPWKSVWRDCAIDSFWSFLVWNFAPIDVVPWPHLLVCVFKIAVVCMWRVLLRSYAAIFFLLLAVISVQVEHLPSLAVFSENLFGSTVGSFLADRSLCEVFCTLASYRGRICQFLCSILLLYACKECYHASTRRSSSCCLRFPICYRLLHSVKICL